MVLYEKRNSGPKTGATADRTGMPMKFYSQYSKLEVYTYECRGQKGKKIDTTDGNLKRREFLTISKHLHGHEKRTTPISAGNKFQGLPKLRETVYNTERYI